MRDPVHLHSSFFNRVDSIEHVVINKSHLLPFVNLLSSGSGSSSQRIFSLVSSSQWPMVTINEWSIVFSWYSTWLSDWLLDERILKIWMSTETPFNLSIPFDDWFPISRNSHSIFDNWFYLSRSSSCRSPSFQSTSTTPGKVSFRSSNNLNADRLREVLSLRYKSGRVSEEPRLLQCGGWDILFLSVLLLFIPGTAHICASWSNVLCSFSADDAPIVRRRRRSGGSPLLDLLFRCMMDC